MRYVTFEDLTQAMTLVTLVQLSNDNPQRQYPQPENVDMAVVQAACASAEELVDGYLRARYVLPLAQVPTIIRDLTVNLTRYRLYARRPEGSQGLPEAVKDLHTSSLRALEQIQAGKVTLGIAQTGQAAPEAGAVRVGAPRRRFDEACLAQWR